MSTVTFEGVTREFDGMDRPAVDHVDLQIEAGELLVLVGPSGCGKSTLLRMLAGIEKVTSGRILVDGVDITTMAPHERSIAVVNQNYALYPHMTVAENMGFALKMQGVPKEERAARVAEAARLLGLESFLDRPPKALSGGQRQRVAMGRAVVVRPDVYLMDEPLSNLDATLRQSTREQISTIQERIGATCLYVTHDHIEAMLLGHRVAVMREGVIQQVADPWTLYMQPANPFVARFIGAPAMNLWDGIPNDDGLALGSWHLPMPSGLAGRHIIAGVRPEDVLLSDEGLQLTVLGVNYVGADAYVSAHWSGEADPVRLRVPGARAPQLGSRITVTVAPQSLHLFDAESGARLVPLDEMS